MDEKMNEVKSVIEKLLNHFKKYNDGSINYQINELQRALEIIEQNSGDAIDTIRSIRDSVYPARGGLSDFYVWKENEEERIRINKPISELGDKLWLLLK